MNSDLIYALLGRTGRVGNPGRSISFVDEAENADVVKKIVDKCVKAAVNVDDWLVEIAESAGGGDDGEDGAANGGGDDDDDDEWG